MAAKITLDSNTTYSIRGRIATFNAQSDVIDDGIIYIKGNTIIDVLDASRPAPDGFSKSKAIRCGGTVYPGLIELHNHLSYNIIPMWDVPKKFSNRDQWRSHKDYRKSMTGPLRVLGHIDGYLQAIVRYVECRLLISGVTSSQGITLASHGGITKFYRGVIRNVEQTVDKDLPSADTKIADIKDAGKLLALLERSSCYLLHLAEGSQESANKHFRALQLPNSNKYAITDSLAGIHAVGLFSDDFEILGGNRGSMVWSPMSNLLLYGVTADIASAKRHGVLIGLGSDWTPSGSKNLLGEIKVARLISDQLGTIFTAEELCRMPTSNAARILKWNQHLGSVEPGKKADLIVLAGKKGDVYEELIAAREQTVIWTIIGGIPRSGQNKFMSRFDIVPEKITLKTITRYLFLEEPGGENPIDVSLKYTAAKKLLKQGMRDLPTLTRQWEESGNAGIFGGAAAIDGTNTRWYIESEHEDPDHRHHIPLNGEDSAGEIFESATPLSELITEPMILDESTVIEDTNYFKKLALQLNLPEYIKTGLPPYYGQTINLNDSIKYKKEINDDLKSQFNYVITLARFWETDGYMNRGDKINVIEQAKIIFSQAYVHLTQKNALYAANPLAQLNVILQELSEGEYAGESELAFHQRIINVFNSVRDLHTMYQLPMPFKDKVTFLPFFVEQYHDGEEVKFIISKVLGKSAAPFKEGVEITHWNGVPINKAILSNGRRYAGSNNEARFARGLDSLTFRPLAVMLPPEEDWVSIRYKDTKGRNFTRKFNWMVGSIHTGIWKNLENEQAISRLSYSSGYDYLTELIHKAKMYFFAPTIAPKAASEVRNNVAPRTGFLETSFPGHFKAKLENQGIGYVRIFSFNVSDPEAFALEFRRIIESFDSDRIIVDIRNNGGGHIWASEYILQTLTNKRITPQNAQFINSTLAESICKIHSPSSLIPNLDLTAWYDTLKEIKNTGTAFSIAYPITPAKQLTRFRSRKKYQVVLITDALCYSASDIFAAGFQDEKIGKILGVHKNTGAGGANVWTHSLLYHLTKDENGFSQYFKPLQYGADMRVAVRRTLRNGSNGGIPLEDLGIVPDEIHHMTKDDLMRQNKDLISHACKLLIN